MAVIVLKRDEGFYNFERFLTAILVCENFIYVLGASCNNVQASVFRPLNEYLIATLFIVRTSVPTQRVGLVQSGSHHHLIEN
jgi:uncharacterized protein YigE (DUF2233 family)